MSLWRCPRCGNISTGCLCCMLCDESGYSITRVVMRCEIDPTHSLQGHLCVDHYQKVFGAHNLHRADARCLQCFPDAASIEQELAAHPEGRHYITFVKAPA